MTFIRPVDSQFPVSSTYGEWGPYWSKHVASNGLWVEGQVDGKGQHKGIDFAVPEGTIVQAMADGLVVASGWENPSNPKQGFGQRIRQQIVTDGGVIMTLVYGHFSLLYLRAGQQVHAGDRIGLSGKTGHVTGPHLHIELIDKNMQYHPILFPDSPPSTAN